MIGAVTFAAGIILVLRHLHVWRCKTDGSTDEAEKRFLWLQVRRRTLTSASIAILGIVIAALDFTDNPISFTILVCASFLLILMIFVLASLDFLAVSQAVRIAENKTGKAAERLVQEYHRMKKRSERSEQNNSAENSK